MTIGIITCWKSDNNYGQQLQCFALQSCLEKMGHVPFLIKYEDGRDFPILLRAWYKLKRLLSVHHKYAIAIENNKILDKERAFFSFKNNLISVYPKDYLSYHDIKQNPPLLDSFIVGSDQVWKRSAFDRNLPGWFLDFVPSGKKKISYAASFGRDSLKWYEKKTYKKYLSKLDFISVREDSGMKICDDLDLHNTYLVADPTLLFDKNFYISSFSLEKKTGNLYFCYFLNTDNPSDVYWQDILIKSKVTNKKLIVTISSGYIPATNFLEGVTNQRLSISDWLNNIYNADIVFTNSFHGVVFSILFHKNFLFFPLLRANKSANRRVYSLLERINLSKRVILSSKDFENTLFDEIDWIKVDLDIEEYRDLSLNFLKTSLND